MTTLTAGSRSILAVLGLYAAAIGCTPESSRRGGSGAGGGSAEGGGGGDTSDGGKGGTAVGGKGGSGGSKGGSGGSGGKGGTSSGGSAAGGSAAGVSSSGGTAAGGSGGTASGGSAAGGSGGTVATGPTWDFEVDTQGWNDGVAHLNMAQCDHGRLSASTPTVSTAQKMTGNSSIAYAIDVAAAIGPYTTLCGTAPTNNTVGLLVTRMDLARGLIKAGSTTGLLPIGTKITMNIYFAGSGDIRAFMQGTNVAWTQGVLTSNANGWRTFDIELTTALQFSLTAWSEMGFLIRGLPADFKQTVYVDNVTIKLP